ncbi:hypothetical protein [Rodentibacter ratti]|nr:hypothetical protein [Rodentibacter ratti]
MAKALLPEIKSYILMSVGFVSLGIDDHCNKMTFTCIESFTTKNEKKAKRFREATGYGMINILPEKTKQRLLALDDYLGVTYYHEGINSSFNSSYKEYEDGMYRVGIDIPEGNYQLFATNYNGDIPIMGSYKLTKDTSDSREAYISSDHFKKNIFITIKNGQYLTINDAYAVEVK